VPGSKTTGKCAHLQQLMTPGCDPPRMRERLALAFLPAREASVMTAPPAKRARDGEGAIAGSAAPRSGRRQSIRQVAALLLSLLAACTVRAPHTDVMAPQAQLNESKIDRLLGTWQREVTAYITREGRGDPGVLSQTRALHARDVLRPARITFDVLDVDAIVPGRDGWDIRGVLVGKQTSSAHTWYVFLVGIVARTGYRPSSIDDIRLLALSAQSEKLTWEVGLRNPEAVGRYREIFGASPPIAFPGDTDRFTMNISGDEVSVLEMRSAAHWSLELSTGKSESRAKLNSSTIR